jgi:hypothetical protein
LTLANIVKVKMDLDLKDVPADGRHILVSPPALKQLLSQSTTPNVSSSDYAAVKALVNGEINTFLGFEWTVSTRMPIPASNRNYCFAWHNAAMAVATGKDISTRIGERADKSYSTQVYASMTIGATRVQEEGVVRFKIDTTA